ncbi:MAG TPA: FAD-binding oxidoreductase [Mycobacteriales bacterium]|jgi:sarcosine oxidase subunit beta|nr:FAD-binding oxidoreductase [Mycobacteriales bacterium]
MEASGAMSRHGELPSTADAVVVGGGTVGGWCAVFLREHGLRDVVVVEAGTLGQGASSRAAGMVRAQGGTETAVRLGMFSREFYLSQRDRYPLDSGFVEQGYLMPAFSEPEIEQAHARIAMQQSLGLDVEWLDAAALDAMRTGMATGAALGASYAAGDGYLEPPRNVLAYTAALIDADVPIVERTRFTGLDVSDGAVRGVRTTAGTIATERVVLTGGPQLGAVGSLAGARVPVGGARHQVVVMEVSPDLPVHELPMAFDLASGIYWRPDESGGLQWGMSNPDEPPGESPRFDEDYFAKMRARMAQVIPATAGLGVRRMWAATIDYTPDHLPILGPVITDGGPITGTVLAAAGGHGMMWGPGVAKVAADLAATGTTDLVDVTDLGLTRFDADGRSSLAADPIALPFPERTTA